MIWFALEVEGYQGSILYFGNLKPEEKVYAIGFPSEELKIITGDRAFVGDSMFHFPGNVFFTGGASGGPVLNIQGEVIGMVVTTSANYLGATQGMHIESLLKENSQAKPELPDRGENLFHREMNRVRQLAMEGDKHAQHMLGLIYENSLGVKQDYEEAVRWYREAVHRNYAKSQRMLGYLYLNSGEKRETRLKSFGLNQSEAFDLLKQAANQGDVVAHYLLGIVYMTKENSQELDEKEAVKWFRLPASQGHADAQSLLGMLYLDGKGVKQSSEEAIRLMRMAAVQAGHPDAQFSLFKMYAQGEGVERDLEEAMKWLISAAQQGHELAISELQQMISELQ